MRELRSAPPFRRVATVTLALGIVGAVVGAILGVLTMSGLVLALGGPRRLYEASGQGVFPPAAGVGAVVGLVLAPVAAWTLMRHVPLWRAIVETALGTALGVAVGLVLGPAMRRDILWPVALGLVGFGAAALRLRLTYRGALSAPSSTGPRAASVGVVSRTGATLVLAVLLTCVSSAVPGTRLEVQGWDCPPAPASCARPVAVRGFPFPYISDHHGISPGGHVSLSGALLGDDLFRPRGFFANVAFYCAALLAVGIVWARAAKLRS